jgi:APA family basic amino acid/polyamine antiporter
VVSTVAGGASSDIIAVAALISTTNTTLLALTAASRMLYAMAHRDAVPRWLGSVTRRTRVPLVSIMVVVSLSAAAAVLGDLSLLAQVTDLSVYLVFVSVNVAVIVLRYQRPAMPRPFRTPWAIGRMPVLPVLGLLSIGVMFSGLEVEAALAGLAVCTAGLAAGLVLDARSPLRRRLAASGG